MIATNQEAGPQVKMPDRVIKPRKPRKKPASSEVQKLINEFDTADQEGETYAMAVAYKRIARLGLNPKNLLKINLRLRHSCDVFRQRIGEMTLLMPDVCVD